MPIVTIQITREGTKPGGDAPPPKKRPRLIKGVSELLLDVLNKPLESTFVVIEEVETGNWGWGGLPVLDYRKKRGARARPPQARRRGVLRSQVIANSDGFDLNSSFFMRHPGFLSHVHDKDEFRSPRPRGNGRTSQ